MIKNTFKRGTRSATLIADKIPFHVVTKASSVLEKWLKGDETARPMYRNEKLALAVSRRWRMLSADHGDSWELMSHEKYNQARNR